MEIMEYTVDAAEHGVRIDKYLGDRVETLSRSHVQKLIEEGEILVNGASVKTKYKVQNGDRIEIHIPEPKETVVEAEDIALDILYEDEDLLIINKPKGMVVHPSNGHESGTLVNALLHHCGDSLSGINGEKRPGIVHRIDMDTTGILVVCKNDMAHQSLSEQLQVHSINRRYRAIVHGRLYEDGTVNKPIGRHPNDRKKMSVQAKIAKDAITHYHVLETYDAYTYVECKLETGRTHQIRVHMASIGHPVLGDEVYGPAKCPIKGLQGQTLHAMTLGFIHPRTGEYVEFTGELPEYFENLLTRFRNHGK